ncbi:hypothetical protein AK830_g8684 [Neonectria ditissima]|uniref:Fructose-bisphosphate aldolase n=1 Tax=Neonectria ditissima TaxID=78410 RepID=A0A0P7BBQ0_9HYPO|nr:hypothetical protein AK830_g8684 [Neonectria ditissima]
MSWKEQNKTYQILKAAEEGGYGVIAAIAYNIEHVVAFVRAAEAKRAPFIIQVFPWAITATDGLLVHAAAQAARKASVPIAVHLDHAQDEAMIHCAADELPLDSIMIDMSHHDMPENLARTRDLATYCHARGVTTEAEPGRIEGGEDGVADTADLQGALTTAAQVDDFVATGIDFLAPAFGNVHGEYGPRGPALDYARLAMVADAAAGRVRIVLHGTNGFDEETMRRCVAGRVSKINVNKLVLDDYLVFRRDRAPGLSVSEAFEQAVEETRRLVEWQIDVSGSAGKAARGSGLIV